MAPIATTPRFRRLLFNAVIVPIALMLVIAALLVWQVERLQIASSRVEHSDHVIAQANELLKLTLDLETGVRGYLLTGDESFLEPYTNALAKVNRQARDLDNTLYDAPVQKSMLLRINSLRTSWLAYAAKEIDRRRQNEDYSSIIRLGEGKSLMDDSREAFRTFISIEERERDVRAGTARRVSELTLLITGVMTLLVGAILAFLSRTQFVAITNAYDSALKTANELNLKLETRVEERTRELEKRTAQLSEANQELEAFGYSISHDLRAPMRHISGFINLVRKSQSHFSPETDELLTTVADTAKLAGKMVDDLLTFSRVGRTPMRIVAVELNPLIEQCRRDLSLDVSGRTIDWSIACLPAVQGDPSLLKMALQNLLANAVKYTSQKTDARIEIGVTDETGPGADPQATPEKKMQAFFVRDNGSGFDMEYAPKLFGVFQRLHRAEEFEGTGIGLANVKRIITRHGGRVWAQSEPGRGATFFFTLPLADVDKT